MREQETEVIPKQLTWKERYIAAFKKRAKDKIAKGELDTAAEQSAKHVSRMLGGWSRSSFLNRKRWSNVQGNGIGQKREGENK